MAVFASISAHCPGAFDSSVMIRLRDDVTIHEEVTPDKMAMRRSHGYHTGEKTGEELPPEGSQYQLVSSLLGVPAVSPMLPWEDANRKRMKPTSSVALAPYVMH